MLLRTRLLIPLGAMLVITGAGTSQAGNTVLFNYSPAHDCYAATLRDYAGNGVDDCTVAIEQQGLHIEALAATYSNRGILLAREGDLVEALRDHDRAVELGAENSSVFINRANALVRARRFSEAMKDLDHAVAMADTALAIAHYNRSLLFQRLGDLRSARAEAEKASTLSPESMAYRQYFERLTEEAGQRAAQ